MITPPSLPGRERIAVVRQPLKVPAWIAARAWSASPPGQSDAEAHTNPVYACVDGRLPCSEADLDWIVEKLDERIAEIHQRDFDEKPAVVEFFGASRRVLSEIREAGGQTLSDRE